MTHSTPKRVQASWHSALRFYALLGVISAACILASIGAPPLAGRPEAQPGLPTAGGWLFGPSALEHLEIPADLAAYVPRGRDGAAMSVRLARPWRAGEDAPGARLLLSPEVARSLAGQRLRIEVRARTLKVTTAAGLALRLEGTVPGAWRIAAVQPNPDPLTLRQLTFVYELTAPSDGLAALSLRPEPPELRDFAYGLEILSVHLRSNPALP